MNANEMTPDALWDRLEAAAVTLASHSHHQLICGRHLWAAVTCTCWPGPIGDSHTPGPMLEHTYTHSGIHLWVMENKENWLVGPASFMGVDKRSDLWTGYLYSTELIRIASFDQSTEAATMRIVSCFRRIKENLRPGYMWVIADWPALS